MKPLICPKWASYVTKSSISGVDLASGGNLAIGIITWCSKSTKMLAQVICSLFSVAYCIYANNVDLPLE